MTNMLFGLLNKRKLNETRKCKDDVLCGLK